MKILQYNDQWWINTFSMFNVVLLSFYDQISDKKNSERDKKLFWLTVSEVSVQDDWSIPLLQDQGEAAHHTEGA